MNGPIVGQNDIPQLLPRQAGLPWRGFWGWTPIEYRRVVKRILWPRTRQVVIQTHADQQGTLTRFTISKRPPSTSNKWKLRFYSTTYMYKPTKKKRKRESGKEKKIDWRSIPKKRMSNKTDEVGIPTKRKTDDWALGLRWENIQIMRIITVLDYL